jgi:hypothetical protein
VEKVVQKVWAPSGIFEKKLPEENNRPKGEYSLNLVTLKEGTAFSPESSQKKRFCQDLKIEFLEASL